MSYSATGTIHKIFDTEQKTDSFRAREFVIEVADGQYPQLIKFQLTQDRCEVLDQYNEGDPVTVQFDLRGREWNGKYFTNLQAWRLEQPAEEAAAGNEPPEAHTGSSASPGGLIDEDIPF